MSVPPVLKYNFTLFLSCISICKMIFFSIKQCNTAAGFHSLFTTLAAFFPPSALYRNLCVEYCMREMCARLSGASRASTERADVLFGCHHFSFDKQTMNMQPLSVVRCLAKSTLAAFNKIFSLCCFLINKVCICYIAMQI